MHAVSVSRLLRLAPVIDTPPWWHGASLRPADVRAALHAQAFAPIPLDPDAPATLHAQRIAWLMHTGWSDPIHVDVGIPAFAPPPDWLVADGNHRLYAAALLGHSHIATLLSGCEDTYARLLLDPTP
jgi:hypothetical protein